MKNFPKELRHGSGKTMFLDTSRLLLSFKEPPTIDELNEALKANGLILETVKRDQRRFDENDDKNRRSPFPDINHTAHKFWVRSASGREIDDNQFNKISENLSPLLDWIGPVYRMAGTSGYEGLLCPFPDVIIIGKSIRIRFNEEDDYEKIIKEIQERYALDEVEEKSKYLTPFRYFRLRNANKKNAYSVRDELKKYEKIIGEARFENMPMITAYTAVPNDTLFGTQWGMTQIHAPEGWDIGTGSAGVVIAVIDSGCDLTHPDLLFSGPGIDLGDMVSDGSFNPTITNFGSYGHGTCCAGIVAGRFNNNLGVAGVAGSCSILPIAFQNTTDAECAAGINFAADNGAVAVSMSFGVYDGWGWDFTIIDPAIEHAVNDMDCVLCAASGNEDDGTTNRYPGRHPLVICCGGSSTDDNRKSPSSPDPENFWGANFGEDVYNGITTGISVVAPAVLIPSTDIQGNDGFNTTNGTAGDYFATFNGTSSATPHVAGFAGLIRSVYPTLNHLQVRNIIEKTAEKVGSLAYAEQAGFDNGTRNQEMGYGRINVFRALDQSDVMIKDWSGDDGSEPSNPPGGDFWNFSDIVVRITDDNVFNPSNPSQSKNVERGQSNYIYIQVTNNGPRDARNVAVDCRITPFIGTQFRYPDDWTLLDAMHVQPSPVTAMFATIASGATAMAKFTISAAQTDTLYGWENDNPWHPCLLASVVSDNDYAFASSAFVSDPLSQLKNNLAQRNLTVIDVLADAGSSLMAFPFIAGHVKNDERFMDIVVKALKPLPGMKLFLNLDENEKVFPLVDFDRINHQTDEKDDDKGLVFLETTKVETVFGCCRGVLTIHKGSRFDCFHKRKIHPIKVTGGEVIIRNGKRYVQINGNKMILQVEKQPGIIYPMSVSFELPQNLQKGSEFQIAVSQRNQRGTTVGGAGAVYYIK